MVRSQASRLNIDPHRIGIMGFSAGGHVAAVTATRFDAGNASDPDPIQRQSSRPDFAVLLYPVISMHDPIAHVGSRNNLLGKQASVELVNRYSADQNVTPQTPPLFICHAQDDTPVPVQNSLQMATAAGRARVPYELVLLKTGGHGFGLGIDGGEPTIWPGRLLHWMHIQHLLSAPAASH
jgi:acetyl esterase/lipase